MWDQVEREVGARLSRVFYDWQRADQGICFKAGLVVLNSLSFYLSVKVLISPLNLNEILAG